MKREERGRKGEEEREREGGRVRVTAAIKRAV